MWGLGFLRLLLIKLQKILNPITDCEDPLDLRLMEISMLCIRQRVAWPENQLVHKTGSSRLTPSEWVGSNKEMVFFPPVYVFLCRVRLASLYVVHLLRDFRRATQQNLADVSDAVGTLRPLTVALEWPQKNVPVKATEVNWRPKYFAVVLDHDRKIWSNVEQRKASLDGCI